MKKREVRLDSKGEVTDEETVLSSHFTLGTDGFSQSWLRANTLHGGDT